MTGASPTEQFWSVLHIQDRFADIDMLRERHGASLVDAYTAAGDASTDERWRAEAVRYTTAEFAIDTAICRDFQKFRQLFPWLERLPRSRGPIVDLGSGEGLLTCFVAMLHPDQPVLGLDISPEAAATASEIASKLGVSNVRFGTTDCLQDLESLPDRPFSAVIAVTFFGPALAIPQLEDRPTLKASLLQLQNHASAIPGLRELAEDGGLLVAADRFSGAAPTWWFGLLHLAGYRMLEGLQMLPMSRAHPLFCSVGQRTDRPGPAPQLFVEHVADDLMAVGRPGLLSLLVGSQGAEPTACALDLRDASKLVRLLTRRHVDFRDRHGVLTVFRSAGSARVVAKEGSQRQEVHLDVDQVDALREALEQLLAL